MKKKLVAVAIGLMMTAAGCAERTNQAAQVVETQPTLTQNQLDQLGATLDVKYRLLSNFPEQCGDTGASERCFTAQIELTPAIDFNDDTWSIYYSQMRPVKQVLSDKFSIERVKGDLHKITPTDKFTGFKAGEKVTIDLVGELWQLSEIDAMPNYYITAGELTPAVIKSTQLGIDAETGMEVRPYVIAYDDEVHHYKRSKDDLIKWAKPDVLFESNSTIEHDSAQVINTIIPTPVSQQVTSTDQPVDLSQGVKVILNGVQAENVQAALDRLARVGVNQSNSGLPTLLEQDKTIKGDGAYQLNIAKDKIVINASTDAGFSYALASLTSLIDVNSKKVNSMKVSDAPRYDFRGMHVDVSRNFHSKAFILDLIDQMAAYKLNKLHLHMADDEGWRLEIDGLPELTDIGGQRCHDLSEDTCLLPQLGSGPSADTKVNGYYSKADYIEILQYAGARQVEVIPSMDMPGHSRAAIISMEARYRKLMAQGLEAQANEYRLMDPLDTTVYSSVQYYDDNTINVCMESSFHFVDKVINEIIALHEQAGQPLKTYHIGADETAGAWLESPVCKNFIANNDKGVTSVDELGAYFIERLSHLIASKGILAAGWSDGMSHTRPEKMAPHNQSNIWDVVSHGGHKRAHQQANLGWDAVLGNPEVLYFDFPYVNDPKEHGYYWASRGTDERTLHSFMPDNLPANAEQWTDIEGKPFEADDRVTKDDSGKLVSGPLKKGVNFKGLQGQIWSETLRSDELVEYMIYPRLLVLAERAWHKASWEVPYDYQGAVYNQQSGKFTPEMRAQQSQQWGILANTLGQKELVKLDMAGIEYRVPTVGAKIEDGVLYTNLIYPGLTIEYRVNGGAWQVFASPVAVNGKVEVRAVAANNQRKGRTLVVN
ncbi:family 20 glycosylhydrolase [Shewanella waksmanii]|uniref:family 20 glycosylhydrolase n=1 Tax=Shewanella waksmanii TaxID=213783 RepID=UPI0037359B2A